MLHFPETVSNYRHLTLDFRWLQRGLTPSPVGWVSFLPALRAGECGQLRGVGASGGRFHCQISAVLAGTHSWHSSESELEPEPEPEPESESESDSEPNSTSEFDSESESKCESESESESERECETGKELDRKALAG